MNRADIRRVVRRGMVRHRRMDDLTDDELFLDMVAAIVRDALGRIGADPRKRLALFSRLLTVAQEVVADRGSQWP